MRTKLLSLLFGGCACLGFAGLFMPNAFGQTLKQVAKFDLPGPGGKRFDYLTIDEDDHYLLSAHLAAGQTYVIDLGTNKVVATITDTPGVEGVEYVPELKKFYTSNAHDNTIGVVDLKQMKVVKKLKTEAKPEEAPTPFHFTNYMSPMSGERRKPSWTCRRMRSFALCTSTAKRECRSTTPLRGRCT
jgi:hypothetical protein